MLECGATSMTTKGHDIIKRKESSHYMEIAHVAYTLGPSLVERGQYTRILFCRITPYHIAVHTT